MQVELNVPVGQTAQAARTHPSHSLLLTLIVALEVVAFSLKSSVPDEPVVAVRFPLHLVIAPAALTVNTFS
jgi:hypothetical protein